MRKVVKTFLIVLTLYFLSDCQSRPLSLSGLESSPPLPSKPIEKSVRFGVTEGVLTLAEEEYKKLEFNILEMLRYIKELEAQIRFYRKMW